MVAIKNPLEDAQYDEQTGIYIGILERKVMAQDITITKYRALLELLTGEKHDDPWVDAEEDNVQQVAVKAAQAKFNMTKGQAQKLIRARAEEAGLAPSVYTQTMESFNATDN